VQGGESQQRAGQQRETHHSSGWEGGAATPLPPGNKERIGAGSGASQASAAEY
jgi:hypothetical protein